MYLLNFLNFSLKLFSFTSEGLPLLIFRLQSFEWCTSQRHCNCRNLSSMFTRSKRSSTTVDTVENDKGSKKIEMKTKEEDKKPKNLIYQTLSLPFQ